MWTSPSIPVALLEVHWHRGPRKSLTQSAAMQCKQNKHRSSKLDQRRSGSLIKELLRGYKTGFYRPCSAPLSRAYIKPIQHNAAPLRSQLQLDCCLVDLIHLHVNKAAFLNRTTRWRTSLPDSTAVTECSVDVRKYK